MSEQAAIRVEYDGIGRRVTRINFNGHRAQELLDGEWVDIEGDYMRPTTSGIRLLYPDNEPSHILVVPKGPPKPPRWLIDKHGGLIPSSPPQERA